MWRYLLTISFSLPRKQMTGARCHRCTEGKVGLRDIIHAGHGDRYQVCTLLFTDISEIPKPSPMLFVTLLDCCPSRSAGMYWLWLFLVCLPWWGVWADYRCIRFKKKRRHSAMGHCKIWRCWEEAGESPWIWKEWHL